MPLFGTQKEPRCASRHGYVAGIALFCLALFFLAPSCGRDNDAVNADAGAAIDTDFAARAPVPDVTPPTFSSPLEISTVGWGRLSLSWEAGRDDRSEPLRITYEIIGTDPSGIATPYRESVSGTGPHVVAAGAAYTVWQVIAIDQAGNRSLPQLGSEAVSAPRFTQVGTGAPPGQLRSCQRQNADTILCTGDNGRYALWDGEHWTEHTLPTSNSIGLIAETGGAALWLPTEQRRFHPSEGLIEVSLTLDHPPTAYRRLTRDPLGLLYWLDTEGAVWAASDFGTERQYRRVPDLMLIGPEQACGAIEDVWFDGPRALVRCSDGRQFLFRSSAHDFEWLELTETDTLGDIAEPVRSMIFGEGREITLLDDSGALWRYDLGGWRLLNLELPGPVTALLQTDDTRWIWVAAGGEVVRLNSLGETRDIASVESRGAIIYMETPEHGGLAITSAGEVFRLATGDLYRGLPPTALGLVVEEDGQVFGITTSDPEWGLYRPDAVGWLVDELPPATGDFLAHQAIVDGETIVLAGDLGEPGGQLLRLVDGDWVTETRIYPPPPVPVEDEDEGDSSETDGDMGDDVTTDPLDPDSEIDPHLVDFASILVGVFSNALSESPPPVPPLRTVALDALTGTGVAAGEGGTVLLWIQETETLVSDPENSELMLEPIINPAGWLQVDLGLPLPIPFLSSAIVGDHEFVLGAVDGVVLDCYWVACTAHELGIGDVHRFQQLDDTWYALGAAGMSERLGHDSWQPYEPNFAAPIPNGVPPERILDLELVAGMQWLLAEDGSVWRLVNGEFQAWGLVEQPVELDFRANADHVSVITRDAVWMAPLDVLPDLE